MTKNRRNYYRILQVQPDAPAEIIRASYRTLMRELKNHPDLGGSTSGASLLNEAYATLSDPERRAAYDRKIRAIRKQRHAAASKPPSGLSPATHCPFCKSSLPSVLKSGKSCAVCGVPLPSNQAADGDRETRRTIARMKKNDSIEYSSAWPEVRKEGTMIDLSPRGMRFRCSERLNPGTVLKIASPLIKACAVVTNQKADDAKKNPTYCIGVSFITVIFEETRGAFFSVSA